MIRFLPDSWRDAVLRPFSMAAPDGGVYVEIMAPDFRFAFILLLIPLLLMLAVWRPRRNPTLKPVAILLTTTAVAFVPWMLTTGNGRYFIPFLLVAGPLCLGLVYHLPTTRAFRVAIATCLVAVQATAIYETNPFRLWDWARWQDAPYFQLALPDEMANEPHTYVTISSISYSLIAPLFPATSRWINLSNAPTDNGKTLEGRLTRAILESDTPLTLLVPSIPAYTLADGQPDKEVIRSINFLLAEHRLAIAGSPTCRLIRSKSMATMRGRNREEELGDSLAKVGFWACPLRHSATGTAARPEVAKSRFDAVFEKVETLCPRFFRPGEAKTLVINGGEVRQYVEADMKVYVTDDGVVLYKYYRAFSPQLIGTVEDVMSGKATVDCSKIRGRSGLPWEREI